MKEKRKLLIVDDSSLIRKALRTTFETCSEISIAGEAANGSEALKMVPRINPDVVTLDINMPVMDGLTTLKNMMIRFPKPTIMCSTLTEGGADTTFNALKIGALDFIHKPSRLKDMALEIQNRELIKKVILAADVDMGKVQLMRKPSGNKIQLGQNKKCDRIIGVGASEGGYSSLLNIIPQLSPDIRAGFVVVLYSDPSHLEAFISYLDRNSLLKVKRAIMGDKVQEGVCYIASGTEYTTINTENKGSFTLNVEPSPFPSQKRAINMLMLSLADIVQKNAAGIILSGEGEDGAEGLEEIFNAGGSTITQAPGSCLSREMSKASIKKCKSHLVISGRAIARKINTRYTTG